VIGLLRTFYRRILGRLPGARYLKGFALFFLLPVLNAATWGRRFERDLPIWNRSRVKAAIRFYTEVFPPPRKKGPLVTLKLRPMRQYDGPVHCQMAFGAATQVIRGPRFVGEYPAANLPKRAVMSVTAEPIVIREFEDVTALGGTNVIVRDNSAFHHPEFKPQRDVCVAERFGAIVVKPKEGIIMHDLFPENAVVNEAVSLLGQSAGNYAHFLTEVLPRLAVINQHGKFAQLPLLIDGWMHPNHIELIRLLAGDGRRLIKVNVHNPVSVARLIDVSTVSYAPPEMRSYLEGRTPDPVPDQAYSFNGYALDMLRSSFNRSDKTRRRIYLHRRVGPASNGRELLNTTKVERIARQIGFELIDPIKLTVPEQIDLFQSVEAVIAPTGAALANLVFTPPGAKVLILAPYFEGGNYYYFNSLLSVLGHDVKYVLGPQVIRGSRSPHPYHANFKVDLEAYCEALRLMRRQ
jgi:hypothetical protein